MNDNPTRDINTIGLPTGRIINSHEIADWTGHRQLRTASEYVLPELRGLPDSALRRPIFAAIKSAGFEPWPKLFTALWATRDRELRRTLSEDQAIAFTGHGADLAEQNYGVELT